MGELLSYCKWQGCILEQFAVGRCFVTLPRNNSFPSLRLINSQNFTPVVSIKKGMLVKWCMIDILTINSLDMEKFITYD